MALIQVNFLSEALMRTVPVQVILPVDKMGVPGSTVRKRSLLRRFIFCMVFSAIIRTGYQGRTSRGGQKSGAWR